MLGIAQILFWVRAGALFTNMQKPVVRTLKDKGLAAMRRVYGLTGIPELRQLGRRLDKLDSQLGKRLDKLQLQLGRRIDRLNSQLAKSDQRLGEIQKQRSAERKWRAQIKAKIDAILRERYLGQATTDQFPFALTAKRFSLISQNEEDGMVLALLATFGVTTRTFVEIGSGTNGGNSGVLAEELGWGGLMIECSRRVRGNALHDSWTRAACHASVQR